MLDKKGQVKAFKILECEGLVTPGPIAISRQVETLAGEKKTAFEAIQLRNTTYTASVSGYMQKIAGLATVADTAQGSVLALAGALSPYITPSGLLQVRIGWEYHVKGHDMDPNLPFPLVEGMADTPALLYSLEAAELDALTAAVNTVNKKVGGTGKSAGSTGTPSSAETQALKEATETMSMQMDAVASESRQVSASASGINGSTALPRTSMANAVTVTLSASLTSDNTMLPAVALILPDALLEDKT